jgi:hypothetical protein
MRMSITRYLSDSIKKEVIKKHKEKEKFERDKQDIKNLYDSITGIRKDIFGYCTTIYSYISNNASVLRWSYVDKILIRPQRLKENLDSVIRQYRILCYTYACIDIIKQHDINHNLSKLICYLFELYRYTKDIPMSISNIHTILRDRFSSTHPLDFDSYLSVIVLQTYEHIMQHTHHPLIQAFNIAINYSHFHQHIYEKISAYIANLTQDHIDTKDLEEFLLTLH